MDKQSRAKRIKYILVNLGFIFVILVGCFLILEYSSGSSLDHLSAMEPKYLILNCLTIGVVWLVIMILCNRIWLSGLLCTVICGLIAVINHYVLMYHGTYLSFLVIRDFATAMAVASDYSFKPDNVVYKLLLMILIQTELCLLVRRCACMPILQGRKRWIQNSVLAAGAASIMLLGYYGDNPIKPPKVIGCVWREAYEMYGFAASTIDSINQAINVVNRPEGYYKEIVEAIKIKETSDTADNMPDVVLIMNETFYDLREIIDLQTDIPIQENIDTMDNLLAGYAVVPLVGGGTNSSEYELLTSNSTQLMPGVTPFNSLELDGANSIVSHMNDLGYRSLGSHSEPAQNYMRGRGYAGLGFEKTYFYHDFLNTESYYGRLWPETDQCLYDNLIRWYEENSPGVPQFQFLVTVQNHGPHDMNDDQYDIVHVLNEYGEYTSMLNEYLTCIYLSDQAFKNLTDYYSTVDRPVVICMVGDHSPYFIDPLIEGKFTPEERELLLRKVPLLIWANFDLPDVELGTMSMNYVVPTLLDIAGIELSPYYSYMLEMKESVPIISSYGRYYDSDGNLYRYDDDSGAAFEELVDNYFYLEYNNLSSSRKQELFDPYN